MHQNKIVLPNNTFITYTHLTFGVHMLSSCKHTKSCFVGRLQMGSHFPPLEKAPVPYYTTLKYIGFVLNFKVAFFNAGNY